MVFQQYPFTRSTREKKKQEKNSRALIAVHVLTEKNISDRNSQSIDDLLTTFTTKETSADDQQRSTQNPDYASNSTRIIVSVGIY
jgi:Na+-transporting NADH:ubiquinone oxidoreductase subunit NqrC